MIIKRHRVGKDGEGALQLCIGYCRVANASIVEAKLRVYPMDTKSSLCAY